MSELLRVDGLFVRFDGIDALQELSCSFRGGDVWGLIGPNGAGKTTLFNVITGFLGPSSGSVVFKGVSLLGLPPQRIANLGIARTFQELRLIGSLSALENVVLCFRNQPGERLANVFFRPRLSARYEAANRKAAFSLLGEVGLEDRMYDPADNLSYGQQKLLSIVCCLAADADLLLLDEPVAGIAPQMVEQILAIISGLPPRGKTVLLIEHDMDAIAQVCDRVIFMDAGRKVCEGTPEEVREDPRVIEAYLT